MTALSTTAAALVLVIGWRLQPRPAARSATTRTSRLRPSILCIMVAIAIGAPLIGAAVIIGWWLGRRWIDVRRSAGAARRTVADYPDALDLLVLSIRAGFVPAQAVVEITPFLPTSLRPAFAAIGEAMDRGERFADALTVLHSHLGPMALPLVDSLSAADRYGLPLAPVLERLAFEARQQRRRDADANARELPVRLAMPLVLCTLPSFVLLAIVPLLLGALSSLHT
jgi:tight adherence protein C